MDKLREIALSLICGTAFFALIMQICENVMLCCFSGPEEESEDEPK